MDAGWLPDFANQFVVMAIAALLAILAARAHVAGADERGFAATGHRASGAARAVLRFGFAGLCAVAAALTFRAANERRDQSDTGVYRDRSHAAVFAAARRDAGMLLTGGDMQLIQLRTRRPVLIDSGGLDGLVYAPESAVAVERVLREVYGIDLFHPPEEARDGGRVPVNANRAVWEGYGFERWQEIARTYGITQVITPGQWQLDLPVVARSPGFALYCGSALMLRLSSSERAARASHASGAGL